MLSALFVSNIVLIDRLDLQFDGGLSVLTGETGAGKSILLDALTLALGGRGDQSLVRKGNQNGQVSAVFQVPKDHPARRLLRDNDLCDEDELVLRRVQFADGRTRATINDQAVSAQLLKRVGLLLVEIHGQHDERALVDANTHRKLLDAFGGHQKELGRVSALFERVNTLQKRLSEKEAEIATAAQDEEFARFAVEELCQLGVEPGEEERLSERRRLLMGLEKAADEVSDADTILSGPASPSETLATLLRRLQRKTQGGGNAEGDIFAPLIEGLDASLVALDQAHEALEAIKREMDFDPDELNSVEERLFAIRAMARKHHVGCDELGQVLEKYQGDLAGLATGNDDLEKLRLELGREMKAYREAAEKLSGRRAQTAATLQKAIGAELPDLKLGAAKFIVQHEVDRTVLSEKGFDQISFHVQTNPGTQGGPLLKVASGGELSRFLLALKVVLADRGSAPVLIFDEIDTGVGGAVADAMGRRLARLSQSVQVLAVTHAPQVAARAARHLLIEKQSVEEGKSMRTHVRELGDEQRAEEVARMLAGAEISEEARAAARRLMSEVR